MTDSARYSDSRVDIHQKTDASITSGDEYNERSRSRAAAKVRHVAETPSDLISTFDTSPLHRMQDTSGHGRHDEYGCGTSRTESPNFIYKAQVAEGRKSSVDSQLNRRHNGAASRDNGERRHESYSEDEATQSVMSTTTQQSAFHVNGEDPRHREMLKETMLDEPFESVKGNSKEDSEETPPRHIKNGEGVAYRSGQDDEGGVFHQGQQW